ncbi:MAG: dienelactone hydrolase [Elusimicrobia bacterium CG11_big_fil_rev_8_21_14_0_20_64_6]|nr:MAG: dienelactone hydrolase [Elusimicrobia bacterium CG11_big_fil_rev_8_21_14_0_20_64_6]
MKNILFALLIAASAVLSANARIRTKVVDYKDGDIVLQGYAVWEDGFKDSRPGILVVHEWWGHGPYARHRAEKLAKLGYTAFALDMYGKGILATSHEEAGKLAGMLSKDRQAMRTRALAGLAELKKLPFVDQSKLGAIGYCFGGATVLELARAGVPLKGVVSFHGSLATPTPATETPKAKILVLHGADDPNVSPQVPAFLEEMRRVKADWQFVQYGGAVHSFTVPAAGDDPSKGAAYNKAADLRSWEAMRSFFKEAFADKPAK